jgi:hypothetical protein
MARAIAPMALTAALFAAGAATAGDTPERPTTEAAEVQAPQALSLDEMESLSGGQGVNVEVLTRQQLSGTTSGNTVNAGTLTSGAVSFSRDALNGFNGVGNFVINTGANNTLQGAINISIVTAPGS